MDCHHFQSICGSTKISLFQSIGESLYSTDSLSDSVHFPVEKQERDTRKYRNNDRTAWSDIDLTSFYPVHQHCRHDAPLHYHEDIRARIVLNDEFTDYQSRDRSWWEAIASWWTSAKVVYVPSILQNNGLKTIYLQDDIATVYWPINVRKMYIELPQYLGLTEPSEFERPTLNMLKTKIMGHRGIGWPFTAGTDQLKLAENTLSNFQWAYLEEGINRIECDIALTKDGVVIVHHTSGQLWQGCHRGTFQRGIKVSDLTWKELREDPHHWYDSNLSTTAVSSLEEVLLWAKTYEDIHFQIELKQGTNYKLAETCNDPMNFQIENCLETLNSESDELVNQFVALLHKIDYPAERLQISSFEGPRLANARRQMMESQLPHLHQIRFALITGTFGNKRLSTKQSQTLIESVLHWNATDVSTFNLAVTQELIEMCEMEGIHVQIGMPGGSQCIHEITTVNQGDGRQAIFDALMFNADILCTNQPILAMELLNDIQSKSPLFQFKNSGAKRPDNDDDHENKL